MTPMLTRQRDIDFVLYELLQVESVLTSDKYRTMNRKMFDMVVKAARDLALKEIFPTYVECDQVGAAFENGQVRVPECLKKPHQLLVEGEWSALTESPEYGGQGLPFTIAQAAMEYLTGANYVLITYPILSHGAGKMIELYGTQKEKDLFLEKLYTGVWGGSMMLTEPEAGSDVGALTTTATKNDDGTYQISGSKIFITNGDQNLTENIIHPVLARIEGAPAGTKGISLFIVPKIWVNEDGCMDALNDVVVTGIEKKMGLHGSPTCAVSLGSRGQCRGLLLGHPGQGMEIMFHMMNEVRLEVGTQAFTSANLAYLYALDYAKSRHQGRHISQLSNREAKQVPIIQHPDVQRMLLKMKSCVEGLRSLTFFIAFCFDQKVIAQDPETIAHYTDLVDILTPIVKAYASEKGFDVCVEAMQVFGGYGYTKEFPVEQILRDCKIASIYEGSNGIQAMDFLGRKISGKKGAMLDALIREMDKTLQTAREHQDLSGFADQLDRAIQAFQERARAIAQAVFSAQAPSAFACAHPLLDACGDIVMAWMLLWGAIIAVKHQDGKDQAFYRGKMKSVQFFMASVLPVTMGKINTICPADHPAVDVDASLF